MVDCLRYDKITDQKVKTRNVDSLRSKGISFKQTIATTSTTTPSFASILTGLYPPKHGLRSLSGYKLKSGIRTLPEILKEKGYTTYAEVTGPLLPELGLDRGFDVYNCREPEENTDSIWFENFLEKLEKGKLEEPWFLLLHLFDLHRSQEGLYSNELPVESSKIKGTNRYEEIVSYLDLKIGELLEKINQQETSILLTADHGQRIAENSLDKLTQKAKTAKRKIKKAFGLDAPRLNPNIGHGFHIYEPLIRIPLILNGPSISYEGKEVTSQIRQIDIFPTVMDVLSLKFEEKIQGKSALNLLEDGEEERPAYMESCGSTLEDKKYWRAGVRTEAYKYIWAPHNENISEELYDLKKDREENDNIAKERPKVVKALRDWGEKVRRKENIDERTDLSMKN